MFDTNFSLYQILPLSISGLILILSIIFFFSKKEKIAVFFLFLGAIGIGFFSASLNEFLSIWDEQFHALVAKNMTLDPFFPKLFPDNILPYDYKNWAGNYIWLHKQPLFLWQIALSIKIFGTTELAVRIPSILLHAIIPLFVFRIGQITINKNVGFIAAILITVAYFPLELINGRYATDHNDIAFLFYVTGSFWAWFEYNKSKKIKYLILIGLFSGSAVLVKWLMGLIVYVIWSITNCMHHRLNFFNKQHLYPIIKSFLISLLIFLPWQIYIHTNFPREASYELALNGRHFFEAIEGHSGGFNYHFKEGLQTLYGSGDAIPFLIIIGLIIIIQKSNEIKQRLFILIAIIFTYLFFSIAETKMIGFTIIMMPFVYLGLSALIYYTIYFIAHKLEKKFISSIMNPSLTILFAFIALNMNSIEKNHSNSDKTNYWQSKKLEKNLILNLNKKLKHEQYFIFNCNLNFFNYYSPYSNIPIMFYTNHIAYLNIPSEEEIKILKNMDKKIAIFKLGKLPRYIMEDKTIQKINVEDNYFQLKSKE